MLWPRKAIWILSSCKAKDNLMPDVWSKLGAQDVSAFLAKSWKILFLAMWKI